MSAVKRTWNESAATMDWTPFPVGYGILLNERYQFPMDMALVRMKLDHSRQLFVDNHIIAHMQGLTRETHSTRSHPENPVFSPFNKEGKSSHAFTRDPSFGWAAYICPDPEHGFRLYYNGVGGSGGWLVQVAYSSDGVNWDLPDLNIFDDFDGSGFPGGPNNVVGAAGELCGIFFEPDDPNPERRWKAIYRPKSRPLRHTPWPYLRLPPGHAGGGAPYELHVSPDGLRWTFEAETNHWKGPVDAWDSGGVSDLYSQLTVLGDVPQYPLLGGGDVFRARWDPKLGKYVGNTKHYIGPDRRFSPVYHAARVVGQIESDDLVHWSAPRIYAYPDGEDAKEPLNGMQGIYEADGFPYESMWLNNFSMSSVTPATKEEIREKAKLTNKPRQYSKKNWIRLAASRDGRHWYYFGDRKPFIPLRPEGNWKVKAGIPNKPQYLRAVNLATTGGPIIKDDELWFYYRGGASTGIATLRRDGFASLNADEDAGLVFTRPFVFEGKGKLYVNAEVSAGGYVRAAVVDEDTAEELVGFTEEDSVGVTEDSTKAPLRWAERESLGEFKDRYVRLAFHLKSAKLYSFWVE